MRRTNARLAATMLVTIASSSSAALAQTPTTAPATTAPAAEASDPAAVEIARRVVAAAGGDAWPTVTRLRFTFNVERGGERKSSVQHDWDVPAGRDTVTWDGRTVIVDVNAAAASFAAGSDARAAFQRWTNDSYWLLAPLKLLDAGATLGPAVTTRDQPPSRARMTMRFAGVGLTPGDRYDLAIDLRTDRLTHWNYRPNPEKSTGFSWDEYRDFNGLTLATEHRSDDGGTRIYFTDVEVVRNRS